MQSKVKISELADRFLWDGEGATSSRRIWNEDGNQSIVGNQSISAANRRKIISGDGGHDDDEKSEWTVAYIREDSFRKLFPEAQNDHGDAETDAQYTHRLKWFKRFLRRHRIVAPQSRRILAATTAAAQNEARVSPTTKKGATKGWSSTLHNVGKRAAKQSTNSSDPNNHDRQNGTTTTADEQIMGSGGQIVSEARQLSVRTTRNQVDGTSLLKKQNARVFNRNSVAVESLSISSLSESSEDTIASSVRQAMYLAQLVRKVSEITSSTMNDQYQMAAADWGDPLMKPLEDDDDHDTDQADFFFDFSKPLKSLYQSHFIKTVSDISNRSGDLLLEEEDWGDSLMKPLDEEEEDDLELSDFFTDMDQNFESRHQSFLMSKESALTTETKKDQFQRKAYSGNSMIKLRGGLRNLHQDYAAQRVLDITKSSGKLIFEDNLGDSNLNLFRYDIDYAEESAFVHDGVTKQEDDLLQSQVIRKECAGDVTPTREESLEAEIDELPKQSGDDEDNTDETNSLADVVIPEEGVHQSHVARKVWDNTASSAEQLPEKQLNNPSMDEEIDQDHLTITAFLSGVVKPEEEVEPEEGVSSLMSEKSDNATAASEDRFLEAEFGKFLITGAVVDKKEAYEFSANFATQQKVMEKRDFFADFLDHFPVKSNGTNDVLSVKPHEIIFVPSELSRDSRLPAPPTRCYSPPPVMLHARRFNNVKRVSAIVQKSRALAKPSTVKHRAAICRSSSNARSRRAAVSSLRRPSLEEGPGDPPETPARDDATEFMMWWVQDSLENQSQSTCSARGQPAHRDQSAIVSQLEHCLKARSSELPSRQPKKAASNNNKHEICWQASHENMTQQDEPLNAMQGTETMQCFRDEAVQVPDYAPPKSSLEWPAREMKKGEIGRFEIHWQADSGKGIVPQQQHPHTRLITPTVITTIRTEPPSRRISIGIDSWLNVPA